jgi:DNA-binding CsgD family transcriptional regulator
MTSNRQQLSEREKETLRLLLQGHDAKSMARVLGISVYTVNERLRASRRKLGVGSSREAARLFVASEPERPNSFVHEQMGVAGNHTVRDDRLPRARREGPGRSIVLAIGGGLIMLLIIAAAMLAGVKSPDPESGPLPNWSTATAAPARPSRPTNLVRLAGNRLLWNGRETSEATVSEFLGVTNQMNPQPPVILSYTADTPLDRVRRTRLLIDKAVQCKPAISVEIINPGRVN